MTARAEDGQIVLDIKTHGGGSGGIAAFGARGQGAVITWGGHVVSGEPFFVSGTASREVAQGRVSLDNGEQVLVPTTGGEAGFSVLFYVAKLPIGARPVAISAENKQGEELEQLDTTLSLEV